MMQNQNIVWVTPQQIDRQRLESAIAGQMQKKKWVTVISHHSDKKPRYRSHLKQPAQTSQPVS